ncbi:hypothetical protein ACLOJK_018396 [Asimina triloba]
MIELDNDDNEEEELTEDEELTLIRVYHQSTEIRCSIFPKELSSNPPPASIRSDDRSRLKFSNRLRNGDSFLSRFGVGSISGVHLLQPVVSSISNGLSDPSPSQASSSSTPTQPWQRRNRQRNPAAGTIHLFRQQWHHLSLNSGGSSISKSGSHRPTDLRSQRANAHSDRSAIPSSQQRLLDSLWRPLPHLKLDDSKSSERATSPQIEFWQSFP